jgi:putative ABC transport system permease protein
VWRRAPFPAALAVLSLAVGWAVATVVASGWAAFRFGPLPYRHAEETIALLAHDLPKGWDREINLTRTEFVQEMGLALPTKFGFVMQTEEGNSLQADGVDRNLQDVVVSPGYFEALGVNAEHGRTFGTADSASGNTHLIVLSNRLWRSAFGAREGVIGSRVYLDSVLYDVVGVMPRKLDEWQGSEAWIPMDAAWLASKNRNHLSQGFVTGVTRANRAEAEVAVRRAVIELHRVNPEKAKHLRVELAPFRRYLSERTFATVILLPVAAAVAAGILFVGCLNFAVLVLLRGAARSREFAIRSALGASPWRIVRRVLAEGEVLVAIALLIGVLIAMWIVQGLHLFEAPIFPGWIEPGLDWRVAGIIALAGVASGAIFALPAVRVLRRGDAQQTLKSGEAGASLNRRTLRLVDALVFAELMLTAIALPTGTMYGVMTLRETRLDVGFNYSGLVHVTLQGRRTGGPGTARTRVPADLARAAATITGLQAVTDGGVDHATAAGAASARGCTERALGGSPRVGFSAGSLVRTLQVPLLAGRLPSAQDEATLAPVALLSKSAAQQLFEGESPLGRSVFIEPYGGVRTFLTVVGVVSDTRTDVLQRTDSWATVFTLMPQPDSMNGTLYLRMSNPTPARIEALRGELARAVPGADVMKLATVESSLRNGLSQMRILALSFGAITSVFVVLAVAGVFGAAGYSVRLRLREVGIRRALGATDRGIAALITRSIGVRALTASMLGLSIGPAGASSLANGGNLLTKQPGVVLVTVAAMLLVVLAGALGPVLRGLRVSPMEVLREE